MTPTTDPRADAGTATPPSPSRRHRALVLGGSTALAAALVVCATLAIRAGAAAEPRPPAAAAPAVETLELEPLQAYRVRRAYAARVEPARQAAVAFETGGTLVEVRVDEGARVAAGTVLARLDTRRLQAKRTRLAAAREALDSDAELARLALERQRGLEARGFAPDESLDRARLATTRIASRVAEADAALALVDVELDKAVLRAPFDALVGERMLDPGATPLPGSAVLVLLEDGAPRLRVGLPPERAATLDPQLAYPFTLGAREVPARLVARRFDVDARTRTVSALFEPIDGAGDGLLFGELAELVLSERVEARVFEVPLAALAEDERGLWSVMSLVPETVPATVPETGSESTPHARLQRVAVQIVHLTGERAYVRAELEGPTRIVADGRHRVVDGERVRTALASREPSE